MLAPAPWTSAYVTFLSTSNGQTSQYETKAAEPDAKNWPILVSITVVCRCQESTWTKKLVKMRVDRGASVEKPL